MTINYRYSRIVINQLLRPKFSKQKLNMSDFLFPIIEILVGIILLFGGGEFFVQGAINLSLILGIPQIVIGLPVVSLGTCSPE